MSAAKSAAKRLGDEAGRLREGIDPAVRRAREVVEDVPDVAERARERASERLAEDGREMAERLAEEGREAGERLAEEGREAAERLARESRESADRVGQYLEDYLEEHEEEVAVWAPRLGFALAGFAAGLLLGWLLSRRGRPSAQAGPDRGFAQAPAAGDQAPREDDSGTPEDATAVADRL